MDTLKNKLKDTLSRKNSTDLSASSLYNLITKLCKDKPHRLSVIKQEYDKTHKDKISTKSAEYVLSILKQLDDRILTVKIYVSQGNRDSVDCLVGLRECSYSSQMLNQDPPIVSKERIIALIKNESADLYVRDLEERYIGFYGNKPSYLPNKTLKEFLHKMAEVELVSSGKNLRVRLRSQDKTASSIPRRSSISRIPSMTVKRDRSMSTSTASSALYTPQLNVQRRYSTKPVLQFPRTPSQRNTVDLMSQSVFIPSNKTTPKVFDNVDMTQSVYVSSDSNTDCSSSLASDQGSPSGSVDMTVSCILPKSKFPSAMTTSVITPRQLDQHFNSDESQMGKEERDVMATIVSGIPPEGMFLSEIMNEFCRMSGRKLPYDLTPVEYLSSEFENNVKIINDDHSGKKRVFKLNSPSLPRRTIAELYTTVALRSNMKPSDRVLRVLKDIYQKKDESKSFSVKRDVPRAKNMEELKRRFSVSSEPDGFRKPSSISEEEDEKSTDKRKSQESVVSDYKSNKEAAIEELKERLDNGKVAYPSEFNEIMEEVGEDPQAMFMEVMKKLDLCLKSQNGVMHLMKNIASC